MRHHRKVIALIFVFFLIGHDCARIQDQHEMVGVASMRDNSSYKSVSMSRWWTHARPVCPMSYDLAAVQERYHKKVTRLLDDVHTMEASEWTTTFLWKLHDIGLRLDGLGSCVFTASKRPELLMTLTDTNDGLMPVLSNVGHRVMAQLRHRGILNQLETPTCKIRLEELIKQEFRKLTADAEEDTTNSTHTLIFGADCDVGSYMSSLGLGAASRKDILDLDSRLITMAFSSLRRNEFQTTESALQKSRDVLERIENEGPDDDGKDHDHDHDQDHDHDDKADDDAGTVLSKELVHDGQEPSPHNELHEDDGNLPLQHTPEKSALIEGHVQLVPQEWAGTLDALVYLGTILGIFVLIIAALCVMAYGVSPVVRFFGGKGGKGSKGDDEDKGSANNHGTGNGIPSDADADYERRMFEAKMEQLNRKLDRLSQRGRSDSRRNSGRASSRRGRGGGRGSLRRGGGRGSFRR